MSYPKVFDYQFPLSAKRVDGELQWDLSDKQLDQLFLGFEYSAALKRYNKRSRFFYSFTLSGHGEELFPIIECRVELTRQSINEPQFTLEMSVLPTRLDDEHRATLFETIEAFLDKEEFKMWWDDDPRGPRKRKLKDKKKLLQQLKATLPYKGSDDLSKEDAEVSLQEALTYFGFEITDKPRVVKKAFPAMLRKLMLTCHPDSNEGSEEKFLYLQKCRTIVEGYTRK